MEWYILDDNHKAVPCTLEQHSDWIKGNFLRKIVSKTRLPNGIEVSTVFLGLDHSFNGGQPILFETMIFGGDEDGYQDRYYTWDEAVIGHLETLKKVWNPTGK